MRLTEAPVLDVRSLLTEERADLVALLRSLTDEEWRRPTAAGSWTVKDVALHLLDDELGWLSRGRDVDRSGLLDHSGDYRDFVGALAAKNQRWVEGAMGLSRRVVCDLIAWSGREIDDHFATMDLEGPAFVIWASVQAVPQWFDLARDFTEHWVHQQQIRDVVERPSTHADHRLDVVLSTFVWAFPFQYEAEAEAGTQVELDLGAESPWTLTRVDDQWELDPGACATASAAVRLSRDHAWRLLTGAPVVADAVTLRGPSSLTDPILRVRGIIV